MRIAERFNGEERISYGTRFLLGYGAPDPKKPYPKTFILREGVLEQKNNTLTGSRQYGKDLGDPPVNDPSLTPGAPGTFVITEWSKRRPRRTKFPQGFSDVIFDYDNKKVVVNPTRAMQAAQKGRIERAGRRLSPPAPRAKRNKLKRT